MAATRERILVAARALLVEHPAAFSLEAVAGKSGVARLTVYRHFASRAMLLRAVIATMSDVARVSPRVQRALRAEAPSDAVRQFVDVAWDVWRSEAPLIRAALRLVNDPEIAEIVNATHRSRYRDSLRIARKARSSLGAQDLARALALLTSPEAYLVMVDQLELTPSQARHLLKRIAVGLLDEEE